MKQIQPVTIWKDGQEQQANYFNAYIVHDNLINSARFYYELIAQDISYNITILTNGNAVISGQQYENWGDSGDINNEAYVILAQMLNLTLI